ncbi:MAG: YihY/virulence factor BrkB family protein [Crocinitomicaceae bacterium]|nr:YihY/virulence factor BrkB family protein [Crocinitomicaceae bacterium]
MTFSDLKEIVKSTFKEFATHRPFLHGAALSYYSLLALIPLLYLSLMFFGMFVGHNTMLDILASILRDQIGLKDIRGIMDFIGDVDISADNPVMEIVGVVMLLFSCSAIMNSLKNSLNEFYGLERKKLRGKKLIKRTARSRFLQIVFLTGVTIFMIALYFGEVIFLSIGDHYFEDHQIITWVFTAIAQHGLPIVMNIIMLTFVYKFLNSGDVKWRCARVGATVTGILLYLGQLLIKYYLFNHFFAAGSGVTGTLLIVLVWVYYSSQILFIGAKFTAVYSRYKGTPIEIK